MSIFDFLLIADVEYLEKKKNVSGLIKALKYRKDSLARSKAAKALGRIGGEKAIDILIKTLNDEDDLLRYSSVIALEMIEDKNTIPHLIKTLRDSSLDIRKKAAEALDKLGWEPTNIEKPLYLIAMEKWEEVSRYGKISVEPLIDLLDYRINLLEYENFDLFGNQKALEENIINKVTHAIIKIGKPAVNDLIDILRKEENWSTHDKAPYILGEIGKPAIDPLIQALINNNENVRTRIIETLGKIKDEKVFDILIKSLSDSSAKVRERAVETLGKTDNKKAIEPLLQSLKDNSEYVRYEAITALGNIGDKGTIDLLYKMTQDKDKEVRRKANEVFINRWPWYPLPTDSQKKLAILLKYIGDGRYSVSNSTLEELIELLEKNESFIPQIVTAICNVIFITSSKYHSTEESTVIDKHNKIIFYKLGNIQFNFQALHAIGKMGKKAKLTVPQLINILKMSSEDALKNILISITSFYDFSNEKRVYKDLPSLLVGVINGEFGDIELSPNLLFAANKSEEILKIFLSLQAEIAQCLEKIGTSQALRAVDDYRLKAKIRALKSLEEIRSKKDLIVKEEIPNVDIIKNDTSKKDWPSKVSGWIGAFIGFIIWGSIGGLKGFIIGVIGGTICSIFLLTPILMWLSSVFNKDKTNQLENG